MAMLLKRTFSAWIDRMPGKPPKLIVKGKAETPTAGWAGVLARAAQQGSDPKVLLLEARLTPPTGPAATRICQIDLRYEEMPASACTHATVRLDESEVTLEVEPTQ